MATFLAHGALGAGVCASVARLCNARPRIVKLAGAYGMVVGAWPDVADWLNAVVLGRPRWELYVVYHHHPPWYWIIQPPFFLHWLVDIPFHRTPGVNWWPEMWWAELLVWIVSGVLWVYAFRRRKKPEVQKRGNGGIESAPHPG